MKYRLLPGKPEKKDYNWVIPRKSFLEDFFVIEPEGSEEASLWLKNRKEIINHWKYMWLEYTLNYPEEDIIREDFYYERFCDFAKSLFKSLKKSSFEEIVL